MLDLFIIAGCDHKVGDFVDQKTHNSIHYDHILVSANSLSKKKSDDLYSFGSKSNEIKVSVPIFEEYLKFDKIENPAEAIGKKVYFIYDQNGRVNCILPEKCLNLKA